MAQTTENTKKSLFDTWIQDDHILVHIDARKDEVSVPPHLKDQHSLTLKLSSLFQGETKTDEDKIISYLKFNNEYFECIIPWGAVWGMTSDQGVQKVWEEDLPKEVFKQVAKMLLRSMADKAIAPFKGADKKNTVEPDPESESASPQDSFSDKRRSMLKRIK